MDEAPARDGVTEEGMDTLAHFMAAFHRDAAHGSNVLEAGYPEHRCRYAMDNVVETRSMRGVNFDLELHGLIQSRTRSDFKTLFPELQARHVERCVLAGHGSSGFY